MALQRLADSGTQAGQVQALDITAISSSDRIVTPVRRTTGNLRLIAWEYDANGNLQRIGNPGDGPAVSLVSCPPVSAPAEILTAFRDSSGDVGLMLWKLAGSSFSVVTSGVSAGATNGLGATLGQGQSFVTAARVPHGHLELRTWGKPGLGKLNVAEAGTITTLGRPVNADVLVTPVIVDCSERLRLIAWQVTQGGSLKRLGDSGNLAGTVSRISCAHVGGKWATAVRDGNGRLKVIFWQREGSGDFARIGDSGPSGIEVTDVSIAPLDFDDVDGVYRVVTAVRSKAARLRVLSFAWKASTQKVSVVEDSGNQPESIGLVRLSPLGNEKYVTGFRDDSKSAGGRLKLVTWAIS